MTVGTTTISNTFTGDGVTTSFPFTFAVQNTSEVQVFLNAIQQVLGVFININTKSDGTTGVGGTVVFSTPPALGASGLIARNTPLTQLATFATDGNIDETGLVNALDHLALAIQQIYNQVSYAITVPVQYQNGMAVAIPSVTPLYVLRVNANGNGFEFVSPAQALAQASPTPGGGTVVGPGTSVARTIALYSDASGQVLKAGPAIGTAGQVLTSQGAGADPIFTTLPLANLKSYAILAPGRQLPTSGAISGIYWHFGNWVQTGNITAAHNTRIYINGSITFVNPFTFTVGTGPLVGGFGSTLITMTGQNGQGLGAPSYGPMFAASVAGGAGGGFGGVGGNGGSATAGLYQYGGGTYQPNLQFCGSSGMGGNIAVAGGQGGAGGAGGGGCYIECTGNLTFQGNVNNFNFLTANGVAGGIAFTSGGGGGGGSGGCFVIRVGGNVGRSGTATYSSNNVTGTIVSVNGGNGGNGFSTTGGAGAAGGVGYFDLVCGGTFDVQLMGGAGSLLLGGIATAGTGSATQPATAAPTAPFFPVSGVVPVSFL